MVTCATKCQSGMFNLRDDKESGLESQGRIFWAGEQQKERKALLQGGKN